MLGLSWPYWAISISVLLYVAYKWGTSTFGFFKDKGVAFLKPWPILGNFDVMLFKNKTFHDFVEDVYTQFKDEKLVL